MTAPSNTADNNGMCPAGLVNRVTGKPIRIACELAYDHSGSHLAAGVEWTIHPRTRRATITRNLTKGIR